MKTTIKLVSKDDKNVAITFSFETGEKFVISRIETNTAEQTYQTTVREFGDSWQKETVKFLFMSELNAIIGIEYKIVDIINQQAE